jgi:hypothetical protein
MAFESIKSIFSNKSDKSKDKESAPLFSNSGEFGSVNLSAESPESNNTIRANSKSSNMFGDLIKSNNNNENDNGLFTLKSSNDSFVANSEQSGKINMDSLNDLAKTSILNMNEQNITKSHSTKYLRIFGITILLFILIGSVLIKTAPTNMQDAKNKFFGYVNFTNWFSHHDPLPSRKLHKRPRGGPKGGPRKEKSNDESSPDRHKYNPPVMPDEAASKVQSSKPTNKSGWCFIGEDRGFRSCVNVNTNDTCMSGKIFENEEKCIHPELRL